MRHALRRSLVRLGVSSLLLSSCASPNPRVQAPAPSTTRQQPVASPELSPRVDVPAPPTHSALGLAEALQLALRESPDLHMARARIEAARAGLLEARAQYLPSLDLNLGYQRADAPSVYLFKTIDSGRFQPGTDFNSPGAFENWEAALDLRWNLYDGGRSGLQREIARGEIEVEQQHLSAVQDALFGAVIDTYFGALAAGERIAAAEESVRTVEARLEEVRARFEEGRTLESDVLSLEVRRAEALELELRARNGRELALATLAQLIGLGGVVELTGSASSTGLGQGPEHVEQALQLAFSARAELREVRARVEVAESHLAAANSAILPRADFFGRGWRDAPHGDFDESRDNWALGLSLSWSVFDGGSRGAGQDRARARLDESQRAARKVELAVEHDVRRAWLRLQEVRARLDVARVASRSAARTLELVEAQFEGGSVPVTRFLEAELMQTQARTRHTNASFDLERARADLARATGQIEALAAEPRGSER